MAAPAAVLPFNVPAHAVIANPPPLNIPPNDNDFRNAKDYEDRVRDGLSREFAGVTAADLRAACQYSVDLMNFLAPQAAPVAPAAAPVAPAAAPVAPAAAPAWAVNMMNNINNRFDDIENMMYEITVEAGDRFDYIEDRLDELGEHLSRVEVVAIQAYNWQLTNAATPFKEVPFPNGQLPSEFAPHLPVLTDDGIITGLTPQEAREYCLHYYPGVPAPHFIDARKTAIRRAIGCRA